MADWLFGPWETEHHRPVPRDAEPGYYTIEATEPRTNRGGVVADTLNRDCIIGPDEDRQIARLIAAAPALLAVAECSEAWDQWSYGRSDKATMEAVFVRYGWDGTVTHPKWLDTFRRAAIHNAIGGAP